MIVSGTHIAIAKHSLKGFCLPRMEYDGVPSLPKRESAG